MRLYIDESGILPNQHYWVYCAVIGYEKEINKKYLELRNYIKTLDSAYNNDKKELKYIKLHKSYKNKIISKLNKFKLNYYAIFYPEDQKIFVSKHSINHTKYMMLRAILLHCISQSKISQIVLDKGSLSNKYIKKLNKDIYNDINYNIKISLIDSKKRFGLQIADLFVGAIRQSIKSDSHKEDIDKNKVFSFNDIRKIIINKYSNKLNTNSLKLSWE